LAKGPSYRVPYRRRREHKTDFGKRRPLATSSDPRLVFRPSNENILVQVVRSEIIGDYVMAHANSREMAKKYGWLGGSKNTSAAYLIGFLAGKRALKSGIERVNLDLGIRTPTKGSRPFAAVKGAQDAGLDVHCEESVIPGAERIDGSSVGGFARTVLEQPAKGEHRFSSLVKRGLKPDDMADHFRGVKAKMEEEFKD